jgi:menaquinone-dependent protoporphyrinogen oxidase
MSRILITYGSKHGSTKEVAETIAEQLADQFDVDIRPADAAGDPMDYAGVVVGGSIYAGRWHPDAQRLLKRNTRAFKSVPLAVFGMGPKSLDEADLASSRAQLEHALSKVPEITPVAVGIFGGVVDPTKLSFPFNRLPACDARDWDAIQTWTDNVSRIFAASPAQSEPIAEASQASRKPW